MSATGQQNHADRAHAVLSASGSDRWMNCTPSARMEEKMPRTSNEFADEGTLAHEIAERALRYMTKQIDRDEYNDQMKPLTLHKLYYPDMVKDVEPYVNHVLEQLATDKNAVHIIEHRCDFSAYVPKGFGTGDSIVIAKKILYITDLKFGKGVRVDAQDNSQLRLYAVGALEEFDLLYDIEKVRMTIVQPRLDHISVEDMTPADLLKWAKEEVKPAAAMAFKGEGEHKTGDWCKFCKAKVFCPALKAEALSLAKSDFAVDQEMSDAAGGDEDWMLEVYHMADRVNDYLSAVKSHVYQRAMDGKKWKGLKLVEGVSKRKIIDEKMARHTLVMKKYKFSDFENTSLKGIGELEKLLGGKAEFEKVLGKYVDRPAAKPILVDDSDPRTTYNSANDFDDQPATDDLSFLD